MFLWVQQGKEGNRSHISQPEGGGERLYYTFEGNEITLTVNEIYLNNLLEFDSQSFLKKIVTVSK